MKLYQWHSPQLKMKNTIYTWIAFLGMVVALAVVFTNPEGASVYALISMGLAVIFVLLSWRVQSQDKQLKKGDKRDS